MSDQTTEQLLTEIGKMLGEKAGEIAADVVLAVRPLTAAAGPVVGGLLMDAIIDSLQEYRKKM